MYTETRDVECEPGQRRKIQQDDGSHSPCLTWMKECTQRTVEILLRDQLMSLLVPSKHEHQNRHQLSMHREYQSACPLAKEIFSFKPLAKAFGGACHILKMLLLARFFPLLGQTFENASFLSLRS